MFEVVAPISKEILCEKTEGFLKIFPITMYYKWQYLQETQ